MRLPEDLLGLCQSLRDRGYQAYVVGGALRDLLLGQTPHDWDIATDALPQQVMALFPRTHPTGLAFGTVTVVTPMGPVEVTTFRQEGVYRDHRHPGEVSFGVDILQDLARRDFTINAMAWDPLQDIWIDPFHGRQDLDRGMIRAVGDPQERFAEDALRILRAIRFSAVLGAELEESTAGACRALAPLVGQISRERIYGELEKTLLGRDPLRGLRFLRACGLWEIIFGQPLPEGWQHRAGILPQLAESGAWRWAALIGLGGDGRLLEALPCPRSLRQEVYLLTRPWPQGLPNPQAVVDWVRPIPGHLLLPYWSLWRFMGEGENLAVWEEKTLEWAATPPLAVGGGEVINWLSIPPGPRVGEILNRLHLAVYESPEANTPQRLRALVEQWRNEQEI